MSTKTKTDLSRKLELYDLKGENKERVLFRTNIPQCLMLDKHTSYGQIFLYDDMTERDVSSEFRRYKKERVMYLKSCGVKTRKFITKNALRDHEWYQLVKSSGLKPNYDLSPIIKATCQ